MNKRAYLLALLVFASISFSQSSESGLQTEWLMFHAYLNHSGFVSSSVPASPSLIWEYPAGSEIESSPAVYGGRVYFGSLGGIFYALNASTGRQLWNYSTGGSIYSGPAVAGGMVFFGSINNRTYALDAATGAYVWNYTSPSGFYSSPAVSDGVLYIGCGDYNVYALNASDGTEKWSRSVNGRVYASPAVSGGLVYAPSYDNSTLYALNASDGTYKWNYSTGSSLYWSSPAVYGGLVYFGSYDKKLYALNASTGALNWSYTSENQVWSSPAIADGTVYFLSDKFYALNASDGTEKWNRSISGGGTSPIVSGEMVFIAADTHVYSFNATTGSPIWSYSTENTQRSSPAIADGMLYVGGLNGKLYAFGAGPLVWEGSLLGQLNVSPTCGSEINATALNFGSLVPGQTSTQQSLLLSNIGSWSTSDITIEATDWISTPAVNFTANYTKWSTTDAFNYGDGTSISNSPASINFNLTNNETRTAFFRVQIPLGQATATYTQNITLTTIC